jgi:hypothetical protein
MIRTSGLFKRLETIKTKSFAIVGREENYRDGDNGARIRAPGHEINSAIPLMVCWIFNKMRISFI